MRTAGGAQRLTRFSAYWLGLAIVTLLVAATVLASGPVRAVAANTVPGNASQVWTDGNADEAANAASQPSKDLLSGYACDDGVRLRFYLKLADLGTGASTATNGVMQSEWEMRYDFNGSTWFIGALVTPGLDPIYRQGRIVNGNEHHIFTSPNFVVNPSGSFGSGPNGVVEVSSTLRDLGLLPGNTLTGVKGLTIDSTAGGGATPLRSVVDVGPDEGGGAYTLGSVACTDPLAPPPPAATTTYFVSTAGSDSNDGLTLGTPFRTIQHCAMVAVPGTTCSIRGGTYRETVRPTNSGTAANPITFTAHDGEDVVVSGTDVVSGWAQVTSADIPLELQVVTGYRSAVASGNVYRTSVAVDPSLQANQLFLDGRMVNEARWPKAGPNLLAPQTEPAGMPPAPQTSAPNVIAINPLSEFHTKFPPGFWSGGQVNVCGGSCWQWWDGTVTSSTPGVGITFESQYNSPGYLRECLLFYCPKFRSPFYLSGKLGALDAPGDWFYDAPTSTLSFYAPDGDPSDDLVELKQREYAFDLASRAHVTVRGIDVNAATIFTDNSSEFINLDRLDAKYVSHFTTMPAPEPTFSALAQAAHLLDTGIILDGSHNVLQNSTVTFSAGNGVSVQGNGNTVANNFVSETNYGGTFGPAIFIEGNDQTVTRNTVYDTAQFGIAVFNFTKPSGASIGGPAYESYSNIRISYNEVANDHAKQQDGGSIYVCCTKPLGVTADHNVLHDGLAKTIRAVGRVTQAGFYSDLQTDNLLVHHNVIWNQGGEGIRLNGHASFPYQRNNKLYNNTIGGGQHYSVGGAFINDMNGSEFINNVFRGGYIWSGGTAASTRYPAGSTWSNNIEAPTDPRFSDEANFDFSLQSDSPGVDAGALLAPFTDGYLGAGPDIGAYESGASKWQAGCDMAVCDIEQIDETDPRVAFTGTGWTTCTTTCDQAGYPYKGTLTSSNTAGDSVTFTFSGVGVNLHVERGHVRGILGVSLDGGPEVLLDTVQHNGAAQTGDQLIWGAHGLAPGTHTVTVRVTGKTGPKYYNENLGATVAIDRFDVFPAADVEDVSPPRTTAVLDPAVPNGDDTPGYAGTYSTPVTTTLVATDRQGSGVATTEYNLDGRGWLRYDGPVTVSDEGSHTLRYRSTDIAGNVEATRAVDFIIKHDGCPGSDLRSTVVVGSEDSLVPNRDRGDGCTINDLIEEDAGWRNKGSFMAHVDDVTSQLVAAAVISDKEKNAIVRAAEHSGIGG